MFSLVIVVVSILLVAALALATLYYGSKSMDDSTVAAKAAGITNQSMQLMSATDLFKSDHARWPADMQELVSEKYLVQAPTYRHDGDTSKWAEVTAHAPAFWLRQLVAEDVCRKINKMVRKDDGIYRKAQPGVVTQCFGESAPYTALTQRVSGSDTAGGPDGSQPTGDLGTIIDNVGDPSLGVAEDGDGWAAEPTTDSPSAGGGDTGANEAINIEVTEAGTPLVLGYGASGTQLQTAIGSTVSKTYQVRNVSSNPGAVHIRWRSYYYDQYVTYVHGLQASSTCGATLVPGASCTVSITYAPQGNNPMKPNFDYSWLAFVPGAGSNTQAPTDDFPEGTQVLQVNHRVVAAALPTMKAELSLTKTNGAWGMNTMYLNFKAIEGGTLDRLGSQQGNQQHVNVSGTGNPFGGRQAYASRLSGTEMSFSLPFYAYGDYSCTASTCPEPALGAMGAFSLVLFAQYDMSINGELLTTTLPNQGTDNQTWCVVFEFNGERSNETNSRWQERPISIQNGACS